MLSVLRRLGLVVVIAAVAAASASARPVTAVSVLKALQAHRMPIDRYVAYTASSDPNHLLGRPGQYVSKVNFHDKRLKFDKTYDTRGGGSVETFANHADAARRFKYVQGFGKTSLFAEYDYLNGTVLLRLSNVLTPKQAAAYKKALLAVT